MTESAVIENLTLIGGGVGNLSAAVIIRHSNVNISNLRIDGSFHHGIYASLSSPSIHNSVIKNSKSDGIYLSDCSANIKNNIIEGNGDDGIDLFIDNSTIESNECARNGDNGIEIDIRSTGTIERNMLVENNGYGIYEVLSNTHPKLGDNFYKDNKGGVYFDDGKITLNNEPHENVVILSEVTPDKVPEEKNDKQEPIVDILENYLLRYLMMSSDDLLLPEQNPDTFRLPILDQFLSDPVSMDERFRLLADKLSGVNDPVSLLTIIYIWTYLNDELSQHILPTINLDGVKDTEEFLERISNWTSIVIPIIQSLYEPLGFSSRAEMIKSITRLIQDEDREPRTFLEDLYEEIEVSDRMRSDLDDISHVDIKKIYRVALDVLETTISIKNFIMENGETITPSHPIRLSTVYGDIILSDTGPNKFYSDYLIIIEPGGDDKYDLPDGDTAFSPLKFIIDMSGDDVYKNNNRFSIASAICGYDVIIDCSGDDRYEGNVFSCGAGVIGAGILLDLSGNDYYNSHSYGQGVGAWGIGLLYDDAGNDQYNGIKYVQGVGFTSGIGMILDNRGRDDYKSGGGAQDTLRDPEHVITLSQGVGMGLRPYTSGGLGLIIEKEGNDIYKSDIFGQGVGYWLGIGGILDLSGDDKYISHRYAQGAGIHLAFGMLLDKEGDDFYRSFSVTQGCGYDFSVGMLIDMHGNDVYRSTTYSIGMGGANGYGFFVDYEGRDVYQIDDDNEEIASIGYGLMMHDRREFGSFGLFYDGGEIDSYPSSKGMNNSIWTSQPHGIGVDK